MACPKCGCKTTYQFDGYGDDLEQSDDRLERCAACGEVFDIEDSADEYDDEFELADQDVQRGSKNG